VTGSVGHSDTRTPFFDSTAGRSSELFASVAATEELRSGLVLNPAVSLASTVSNETLTGLPGPPTIVNTASVSFMLRQPLLRHRRHRRSAPAILRPPRRPVE